MCRPSVVTEDWVVKGCHIHIGAVELGVCPDHLGGVVFKAVFSSTPEDDVDRAIRIARTQCLVDPVVRNLWIKRLASAIVAMPSYQGKLKSKANGRMLEFKILRLNLLKIGT